MVNRDLFVNVVGEKKKEYFLKGHDKVTNIKYHYY